MVGKQLVKQIKNSITAKATSTSKTLHYRHSLWNRKRSINVFCWVFLLFLLGALLHLNLSILFSGQEQYHNQQPQQQQQQQSVIPTPFFRRSPSLRLQAQACVRSAAGQQSTHYGNIYIKHFRKTGGSTLNKALYLHGLCANPNNNQNNNTEKITRSRRIYASEYPYFNVKTFETLLPIESTIYITALRHPVDRILSMYWYEGRWPRTCGLPCEAAKIKNDSTKVADLEEWVEAVYHQTHLGPYRLAPHTACGQWQSVENYYIRQLLGIDRGHHHDGDNNTTTTSTSNTQSVFLNKTITQKELDMAKAVLDNFDLVLISEHFSGEHYDEDMIHMFLDITGALYTNNDDDDDGQHINNKSIKKNFTLPHHRKGLERETLFQEPHPDTVKRLLELNKWDVELYQYALQLKEQRVAEWKAQQQSGSSNNNHQNLTTLLQQCGHEHSIQDNDEEETKDAEEQEQAEEPMLNRMVYQTALSGEACQSFRGPYYLFHPNCLLHSYPPPTPPIMSIVPPKSVDNKHVQA